MGIDLGVLAAVVGVIPAIGAIYGGVTHLTRKAAFKRETYRQSIIDQAKLEADKIKEELDEKISRLEMKFKNQRESVQKDLSYMKEDYTNDIKLLGEKIQELRSDLSVQHQSLLQLLTKLVESK